MLTLVPISSNRSALHYLTQIGTISRMAEIWTREVKERPDLISKIGQECSVALFSALRNSLLQILEVTSRKFLTVAEFHQLLKDTCEHKWREGIKLFEMQGTSLGDVLVLIGILREIAIQTLDDANLNGYDSLKLLVLLFDWVQHLALLTYESNRQTDHGHIHSNTLAIHDLHAIVDSVRSPVDLRPVFQLIVDRVRNSGIWPMCAIGITDRDGQEIIVPAQSGFVEGYPHDIKFPAIGSATLATIQRNKPIAISDVSSDREFPVLQDAARAAGYRSILLLPLILEDFQGVVTFGSPEPHEFTDEEIILANAIAQQILIAIDNARYYEREKQRVEQLEKLNRVVSEQNRLLQRSAEIHKALTQLVLDNAGMGQILQAVRNLLGNPIAIENEYFQLLGYSDDWDQFDKHRRASIKAGGTVPEVFKNPEISAVLEVLHQNRRPILIPTLESIGIKKRRIVAPIVAGGDIMGYIWVMESSRLFEDQDFITIEQAARVLALEMMKQRVSYETELRLKADFIGDLLSERADEPELTQRASYLGYNLNYPSFILVVDLNRSSLEQLMPDLAHNHINRQVVLNVQRTVTNYFPVNLVVQQLNRILILLPAMSSNTDLDRFLSILMNDIRKSVYRIDPSLDMLIGIGDLCQKINEIRTNYLLICRAIDIARKLGWGKESIRLADLDIYGLLFLHGDNNDLHIFFHKTISPLIDYDAKFNTNLLNTLDIYLSCGGRLAESARKLYIHVNTLRQRLKRIKHILGMELDDPQVRLKLQLALNIHRVANFKPSPLNVR